MCTIYTCICTCQFTTYFFEVYTIFKDLSYQSNRCVMGEGIKAVLGSGEGGREGCLQNLTTPYQFYLTSEAYN